MKLYRYRRVFQTVFLAAFFVLLTLTFWPLGAVYLGAFLLADPLIALNSIAGGIWKWEMLLAVFFLALPLVLGRAFCGYVCPLGFLTELIAPRRSKPGKTDVGSASPARGGAAPASRRLSPARDLLLRLPPFILVFCLGLLMFGSAVYLVFDPLSLLTRSAATLVYPLVDRLLRIAGDALYLVPAFRLPVDTITTASTGILIYQRPLAYQLQVVILLMIVAVLGLSFWQRRTWCRHLCPLGALLGFVGRVSMFGRVVDRDKCTKCGICEHVCPLDAVRGAGLSTDKSRCQLSFECADACPAGAIGFGRRPPSTVYNPSRRAFLAAGSLALLAGYYVGAGVSRAHADPRLVRPPGARPELAFSALCSRCGQCMKVCPTNVLQPSVWKAGVEGMFTPEMSFDHAYCDWSCNECGKVCPTGAITALTLPKKRKTKIGRASIDRNRCIPWADYKNCLVCQELCPTPKKAVVFTQETVRLPEGFNVSAGRRGGQGEGQRGRQRGRQRGGFVTLKRPVVVADRCIGCGICENRCPVPSEPAIVVRGV